MLKSSSFWPTLPIRHDGEVIIHNHMTSHYNRLSQAKAIVDTSAPSSMVAKTQCKQQRLRKEKHKEHLRGIKGQRGCSRSLLSSRTDSGLVSQSSARSQWQENSPDCEIISSSPMDSFNIPVRHSLTFSFNERCHNKSRPVDSTPLHSGLRATLRTSSLPVVSTAGCSTWQARMSNCEGTPRGPQDQRSRTYSGNDLLECHANVFTPAQLGFQPRTLRTNAHSALASQLRHYTPARRRTRTPRQDCGVQTEPTIEQLEAEKMRQLLEKARSREQQRMPVVQQRYGCNSELLDQVEAEAEELKYMQFVKDISQEVLTLGLFSDSIVASVCEIHLQKNKHRLDKARMLGAVEQLKRDLGCRIEGAIFNDHSQKRHSSREDLHESESDSILIGVDPSPYVQDLINFVNSSLGNTASSPCSETQSQDEHQSQLPTSLIISPLRSLALDDGFTLPESSTTQAVDGINGSHVKSPDKFSQQMVTEENAEIGNARTSILRTCDVTELQKESQDWLNDD
uniref:spermatogenesis-associated protein 7 isoform X1 n=2 Tax=Myxine glutinosa TaxID=7769 RepID=UPI00358F8D7C